jgi:hypothetical protein
MANIMVSSFLRRFLKVLLGTHLNSERDLKACLRTSCIKDFTKAPDAPVNAKNILNI